MAEDFEAGTVLAAMLAELARQGFGGGAGGGEDALAAYPVHGTLDVEALAVAVENALRGGLVADAKEPSDLNAANDG